MPNMGGGYWHFMMLVSVLLLAFYDAGLCPAGSVPACLIALDWT